MRLALCTYILVTGIVCIIAQDIEIDENTKDVPLFNITYTLDSDCTPTRLGIKNSDMSVYFRVGQMVESPPGSGSFSSLVTLIKELDYEQNEYFSITTVVACEESPGQRDLSFVRIFVGDVLDSQPQFSPSVYTVLIPENQPIGTVIVSGIFAIDADSSDRITYSVLFNDKQKDLFASNVTTQNANGALRDTLQIILTSPLDFETSTQHRFTVMAKDSVNMNDTCDVIINVRDVQDTAPTFSLPFYSARISETAPKGSVVVKVSAADGDLSATRNGIAYSFKQDQRSTNLFDINNTTGDVIVTGDLDIDKNLDIQMGQILLEIEATEIDPNTSMASPLNASTSSVQVQVVIVDANDNKPQFNAVSYAGSIRENAMLNELVSLDNGGFISIVDIDRMPNYNGFTLRLDKDGVPWSVFEPSVKSAFSQASVLVALKQPEALRGLASTHVKFQIVATETSGQVGNRTSASADFLLWIIPPTSEPEAVVDIPLRTSDFIIFVIGVLLLLNIVLTFLLFLVIRRQNNSPSGFFKRNHKYYVSERDRSPRSMSTTLQDDKEDGRQLDGFSNPKDGTRTSLTSGADNGVTRSFNVSEDAARTNTVASVLTRSRCDVAPMEDQHESEVTRSQEDPSEANGEINRDYESVRVVARPSSSGFPQNATLQIRKETGRCDVTPLRSQPSGELSNNESTIKVEVRGDVPTEENSVFRSTQCDVIPHETGKSLSNLLHRVHQKLSSANKHAPKNESDTCDLRPIAEDNASLESNFTDVSNSNNSSFSNNVKCDVTPLIGVQGDLKNKHELGKHDTYHINPAFSDDASKKNEYKPNLTKNDAANAVKRVKSPAPIPTNAMTSSGPTIPPATYPLLPPLSTSQTQITKTGVPPIALALPFSTAVVPKDQYATVTNPVFKEDSPSSANNSSTKASSKRKDDQRTNDIAMVKGEDKKTDDAKAAEFPPKENISVVQKADLNIKLQSVSNPSFMNSPLSQGPRNHVNDINDETKDETHVVKQSPTILGQSPQTTKSEPNLNTKTPRDGDPDFVTAAKRLLQRANSGGMSRAKLSGEKVETPNPVPKPPRNIAFKDKGGVSDEKLTQL